MAATAARTPFVGSRLSPEITRMVPILDGLEAKVWTETFNATITYIEKKDMNDDEFISLYKGNLKNEDLEDLFAGILSLLKFALRLPLSSLKEEHFSVDLHEIGIPKQFASDVIALVRGPKRRILDDAAIRNGCRFPKLTHLRWRVDVSISTSSLHRCLKPHVVLRMELSDGSIRTMEVPTYKFHELRYNVAYVLKEMEAIERKSILKIVD